MKYYLQLALATAWSLTAFGSVHRRGNSSGCDRACLESLLSDYLIALTSHDASLLPTTPDVKYAENDVLLPLGTGEWKVASSLGKYRHIISDPVSRQVAAITTLQENGKPVIYIVRLATNPEGEITEIQTHITRDSGGAALYENMTTPEPAWLETIPPEYRIPRAKLIAQTDKYYTGMERNNPKGNYSFFDPDCNRLEDGLQTTNQRTGDPYGHSNDTSFASLGCEAQFQTGFLGFVTKIRDRRYDVVDEERQAVLAFTTFDHNGTVRELPSVNGTSSPIPPYFDVPRTLAAAEAFRLRGEKLWRIEMTLTEVPYGARSPFVEAENFSGAGTNLTVATSCGRTCLEGVVDKVLASMLHNDTTNLPLARGVRYSENGQFIAIGDGLWETLDSFAIPDTDIYAARFADPETGTVAYWGSTLEETTLGVLALRIKVDRGQITEIEANSVRAEFTGPRGGTQTLMRPPLPVEWNGTSLGRLDAVFKQNSSENGTSISPALLNAYFDGLEHHSSAAVPFAASCSRRDNGLRLNVTCAAQMDGHGTTSNGLLSQTSAVRNRRILIADERKGVVLAVAMVDYSTTSANGTLPANQTVPSSYMVQQLIKVENWSILRVESMIKWMPFGYASVWSGT
ncbi:hypothetical protein GQ43DRAFT_496476 [Delitschia confertaspora ATCC 74209]|uniref:DUF8021 domain-containing protein n=1 Tax=Delitschia confertaspora ATCC 74209 TaxID=1513339 RepID=A0A9P4MY92_9PLEO|nr:hypothetical protein GQ43DRAFT_496476 [Delitschia confertaspora ATCC 74209]